MPQFPRGLPLRFGVDASYFVSMIRLMPQSPGIGLLELLEPRVVKLATNSGFVHVV